MYLSKLMINVTSREFRRDYADVQDMHRTIMRPYLSVRAPAVRKDRSTQTGPGWLSCRLPVMAWEAWPPVPSLSSDR
ncbi:hypothetical protein TH66_18095 [Carbonactinospora thermoautotrophica]|uniref:Uncharacterized protein n=1 Tax=Carbonactinospora thermoautotrophica TaxID=1469144 RepID=A0A132MIE0_9ACTN|nr:hypothetical protein TH66_18095 [Carbonactinospora thermoautotrophica]